MTPADLAVVAALRAEVADVRIRLARVEAGLSLSNLSRKDRRRLAAILPVIAAVFGSSFFTVKELRDADHAGLRLVLADLSPETLGRLLARGVGLVVDDLVVERVAAVGHAVLWRVMEVLPR